MKRQISDEQFERMMQTLMCDASVDGEELSDIASSPTVWWAVQREINAQKVTAKSPWPPSKVLRRWLLIGVPAAAAVLISLLIFRSSTPTTEQSYVSEPAVVASETTAIRSGSVDASLDGPATQTTTISTATGKRSRLRGERTVRTVQPSRKAVPPALTASTGRTAETKTEFISLTYARNPESGQIVRVKVPSSMMVSVGLVASVERPASLVDAEVLIGDDGLTRAIRFIR